MTWRNNLLEASFRGEKFFVESHSYNFGRRNIVHKYPFQDEAYVEDLGQEIDEFSIVAYIIQKPPIYNYFHYRDKLIKVLKEEGAGILIHRYLGEKKVAVKSATMSENTKEGGWAKFSITFVEAGKNQYPEQDTDPKGLMDFAAVDAINRALDAVGEVFDIAQSISDDITSAMGMIKSTIRTITSVPASVISVATSLITEATSLISTVLNSPCALASAISGAMDAYSFSAGMLADTVNRGVSGNCSGRIQNQTDDNRDTDELTYNESRSIAMAAANMSTFGAIVGEETVNQTFGGGLAAINVISPTSAARQANRLAVTNLIRTNGLALACQIAVRATYESQQEVEALYGDIAALIDAYLEYLGDQAGDSTLASYNINFSNDEFYDSVKALKPAFKSAMDSISAPLAKNIEFEIGTDAISSLKLAYDRYYDLDRADEIVKRNKTQIFHPGFLPNGETIDILSE